MQNYDVFWCTEVHTQWYIYVPDSLLKIVLSTSVIRLQAKRHKRGQFADVNNTYFI